MISNKKQLAQELTIKVISSFWVHFKVPPAAKCLPRSLICGAGIIGCTSRKLPAMSPSSPPWTAIQAQPSGECQASQQEHDSQNTNGYEASDLMAWELLIEGLY